MIAEPAVPIREHPILLYNGECAVCRVIARWVGRSAERAPVDERIVERPIGDDPVELRTLDARLDIWDAYETIHLLMPDGTMKLGGEAVAEVFRSLPNTRWFAWTFALGIFGFRPFQLVLDLGYTLLSDVRPLLGCESCGTPNVWVRAIRRPVEIAKAMFGAARAPAPAPHFSKAASKP